MRAFVWLGVLSMVACSETSSSKPSAPTITSFSPAGGAGVGLPVSIHGANLNDATAVAFNDTPQPAFTIVSAERIDTTVPAGATSGPISVKTPGGTAMSASFTVVPAPAITQFSPATGCGVGLPVTLHGTNLLGATRVTFGGTDQPAFEVISEARIDTRVPEGATSGPIVVTTPGGTATSASFTVVPAPTVTGISPTGGAGIGLPITIHGTDLSGTTAVVFNGTSQPTFTVVSAQQIETTVPAGATSGPIVLTTPGGTATSALFTVLPAPTVTAVDPAGGAGIGLAVTIHGNHLTGATAVLFNGTVQAAFTVVSAQQIDTTVPAGATSGPIVVTTPGGTATTASFTVMVPPSISGFSPAGAGIGLPVTIHGTGLTGATAVSFNGARQPTFTVVSAVRIDTIVPPGATSGPIEVTTPGGTATSASFTIVPAPVISSVSPEGGAGVGLAVTIYGAGFSDATAVAFNGVEQPAFTVVSAVRIDTTVPPAAISGPISVSTPGGTSTSASFTVVPTPSIAALSPEGGAGIGQPVTIHGAHLLGVTAVSFNGIRQPVVVIVSASEIVAVVPPGATSGPIAVTTPGGTAISPSFTIHATPVITGFTPAGGAGVGLPVTIHGANLASATSVSFHGTNQPTFTVVSAQRIDTTVPAGATSGPLMVTTPHGTATSASFTVIPAPAISGFLPAGGAGIGLTVTIQGTSLGGATAIDFNGTDQPTFTVVSVTRIDTTVPVGATSGPITVTTPGGTATSASFTIVPAPAITSFSPEGGAGVGMPILIRGTNLTGATHVAFHGQDQPVFSVASAEKIATTVPQGATSGPITVTTPGGTATSAFFQVLSAPTIVSISPEGGAVVGQTITIRGLNLNDATAIVFNGVEQPVFLMESAESIRTSVPAGATSGPLAVTTPGGTATASFIVRPTITSVTPATGPSTGGVTMTIAGTLFADGATVTVGGAPATNVVVVSSVSISATLPPGTFGPTTVLVENPDGGAATSQFDYYYGTVSFDTPLIYTTLYLGDTIVTGDFNGDGKQDVLGSGSGKLAWGNGDGSFQAPIATDAAGATAAVASFDGNDQADVVVANSSDNSVTVYFGGGEGLVAGNTYAVGTQPDALVLRDFNGDGTADVVTANRGSDDITFLPGNGDGTFGSSVSSTAGVPEPFKLATADVNGDGNMDLVLISYDNSSRSAFVILVGDGDGAFELGGIQDTGVDWLSDVAVADYNVDGLTDLAFLGRRVVALYEGTESGELIAGPQLDLNGYFQALVAADLDTDGRVDLVTFGQNAVRVARNSANGWVLLEPEPPGGLTSVFGSPLCVADVNDDTIQDIVISSVNPRGIATLLGLGDGTFDTPPTFETGGTEPIDIGLADLDGDGDLDVVVLNQFTGFEPNVVVMLGDNAGGWTEGSGLFTAGNYVGTLEIADFDANGSPDIAIEDSSGAVIHRNLGQATFDEDGAPVPFVGQSVGDYDGDGKPDLATSGSGIFVTLNRSSEDGIRFDPVVTTPISDTVEIATLASGDFNADGRDDVAVSEWLHLDPPSGPNVMRATLEIFLSNGDGTFHLVSSFTHTGTGRLSPPMVADLDADGNVDVFVSPVTCVPGCGMIYLGKGDGTFTMKTLSLPQQHGELGPAFPVDVNRDGVLDIVIEHYPTSGFAVILGVGDGTFTPLPYTFAAGTDYDRPSEHATMKIGDVNGDGLIDVLTVNWSADTFTVVFGNSR